MTAAPALSRPLPPIEPGAVPTLREVRLARRVQARLFPQHAVIEGTLEAAGFSRPAAGVGGDFFDFLPIAPGRIALAIGDACGKGLPAALIVTALQSALRSHYALPSGDLAARVRALNRLLYELTEPEHYATLFLGEYDDASGQFCYANCGHPAPLAIRHDGSTGRLDSTGVPLGLFPAWRGDAQVTTLAPGDALLLVTDGISERVDATGDFVSEQQLVDAYRAGRARAIDLLVRELVDAMPGAGGAFPSDDATVVVARRRAAR
jgi:sigma-B regulation protein RsbU (phosphoserine phosphatase)